LQDTVKKKDEERPGAAHLTGSTIASIYEQTCIGSVIDKVIIGKITI
jgi:hypothetical protein